jgi:hypothetical protein
LLKLGYQRDVDKVNELLGDAGALASQRYAPAGPRATSPVQQLHEKEEHT